MEFYDILENVLDFFDGTNRFLRKFLSHQLYRLPRKRNGKKRMIYLSETMHLLLFPVLFLYSEICLRLFTGTGVFQHLIYPIIYGLAYGLLLDIPTTLFSKKVNRRITIGLIAVIQIFFGTECLVRDSYKVYMSISALIDGAEGVATGYTSNMIHAILGNILPIIAFLLPLVLYIVLGKRFLQALRYKPTFVVFPLVLGIAFLFLGNLMASTGKTADHYKSAYSFDNATIIFGLPTSFRLSLVREGAVSSDFAVTTMDTTPAEESTEAAEAGEAGPVTYGKNEMDLDFTSLLSSSDSSVVNVTNYIQSLTPTSKNAYTGLFEGKNLIMICAEAYSDACIDPDLTPTLYRMMHNGFYFSDYYQPAWGGSTLTGEFSFITGLVPGDSIKCVQNSTDNNLYFTLGNALQREGYANGAFHNGDYSYYSRYETHPNLGYGEYIARGNGLHDLTGLYWPQDNVLLTDIVKLYADEEPFSLYFMTVNGHAPYTIEEWYLPDEYLEYYKQNAKREYEENTLIYLAMQYTLEVALTQLIDTLEELGLAEDTVIVMTGDHYPYGLSEGAAWGNEANYILDLYGVDSISEPWDRDHNALFIWSKCLETDYKDMACEISGPTYSLDIAPTLMNLFGLEFDSRLYAGRDVFSEATPLVLWNGGHWKTEYGTYNATSSVFTPAEGVTVSDDYVDNIKSIVANKKTMSTVILDTDYYGLLFGPDTETGDNRKEDLFEAAVRIGTAVKPEGTDSAGRVNTD